MHNYNETLEFSWNIRPNRSESNRISSIVPDLGYFDVVSIILNHKNLLKALALKRNKLTHIYVFCFEKLFSLNLLELKNNSIKIIDKND